MLSIIVPVYNVKDYIEKCVDSIINQTFTDIEIILVDDGSDDGSAEICDKLKLTDSRINVFHQENGGLMSAWITGVKQAKGTYIGFVDSDDFCEADYFETLMKPIIEQNVDITIGGYCIDYPNKIINKPIGSAYLDIGIYENNRLEEIKTDFFKDKGTLFWARWLRVIRKDIVISNLYLLNTRIKKGEDIGIALATLYDSKKIALVKTASYHYVQRETSIMNTISENEIDNFEMLCKNIENICNVKGYKKCIYREFTTQMLVLVRKICQSSMSKTQKRKLLDTLRNDKRVEQIYIFKDFGIRSFAAKICLQLYSKKHYSILLAVL